MMCFPGESSPLPAGSPRLLWEKRGDSANVRAVGSNAVNTRSVDAAKAVFGSRTCTTMTLTPGILNPRVLGTRKRDRDAWFRSNTEAGREAEFQQTGS